MSLVHGRGFLVAVIILSAVVAGGVSAGVTYLDTKVVCTIYHPPPVNVLVWSINRSVALFGDGAGASTASVTGVMLVTVSMNRTIIDKMVADGLFSIDNVAQYAGNYTIEQRILYLYTGGQLPVSGNETYPHNEVTGPMILGVGLLWANGSKIFYTVQIDSILPQLPLANLFLENDTTYSLVYGGMHYNSTLGGAGDVDYAAVNFNGLDLNVPVHS